MIAENPAPDNDTMLTLIETNEQLNKAMNLHQRAVLSARQAAGNASQSNTPPQRTDSGFAPPPGPPPNQTRSRKAPANIPQIPPPGDYAPTGLDDDEDPFADPKEGKQAQNPPFPKDQPQKMTGQFNDRLGIEPYHPGFQETESYVGRQENAVGSASMSAAGPSAAEARNGGLEGYGVPPAQAPGKSKKPVYKY